MIKTALAKVLTVKAAAVLAALSAGGVAVAASAGVLPVSFGHSPSGPSGLQATEHPGVGPVNAHATPSPSLVGLCHAFLADAGADQGKALESPAFTVLITTAGGKDHVDAYCADLLADSGGPPSDHPSGPAPSHPTGPPPHPTGPPTSPPGLH